MCITIRIMSQDLYSDTYRMTRRVMRYISCHEMCIAIHIISRDVYRDTYCVRRHVLGYVSCHETCIAICVISWDVYRNTYRVMRRVSRYVSWHEACIEIHILSQESIALRFVSQYAYHDTFRLARLLTIHTPSLELYPGFSWLDFTWCIEFRSRVQMVKG